MVRIVGNPNNFQIPIAMSTNIGAISDELCRLFNNGLPIPIHGFLFLPNWVQPCIIENMIYILTESFFAGSVVIDTKTYGVEASDFVSAVQKVKDFAEKQGAKLVDTHQAEALFVYSVGGDDDCAVTACGRLEPLKMLGE